MAPPKRPLDSTLLAALGLVACTDGKIGPCLDVSPCLTDVPFEPVDSPPSDTGIGPRLQTDSNPTDTDTDTDTAAKSTDTWISPCLDVPVPTDSDSDTDTDTWVGPCLSPPTDSPILQPCLSPPLPSDTQPPPPPALDTDGDGSTELAPRASALRRVLRRGGLPDDVVQRLTARLDDEA